MDEITRDVREGGVKEILYADDMVFLGGDWIKVENKYFRWKKAMKEKDMKVNVCKTKVFLYWLSGGIFSLCQISVLPAKLEGTA